MLKGGPRIGRFSVGGHGRSGPLFTGFARYDNGPAFLRLTPRVKGKAVRLRLTNCSF